MTRGLFLIIFVITLIVTPSNINKKYDYFERTQKESALFSYCQKISTITYNNFFGKKFLQSNIFENNHIVAYYGHPKSKIMGIVGRYPITELAPMLLQTASSYDKINGNKGVIPAIYLIYGTCQPGGEINRINKQLLQSYIDFTLLNGMLLYLDHQIGKYTLAEAIRELLPYLRYPNVHLAFDPEWHTTKPMREIGSVTAQDINSAQIIMRDYMIKNNIPGVRQLVFHQFKPKMVIGRDRVIAMTYPVMLIHTTSGWGPPENKMSTHEMNSLAVNMPNKGFKLWFFYSNQKGVHFDNPLMTPEQVLNLKPEPKLIIYQ
jgi:hypothetical protein